MCISISLHENKATRRTFLFVDYSNKRFQARIQVLELEGAKLGEGSGDHLGPQSGPGQSPGGGTRREKPPEAPAI